MRHLSTTPLARRPRPTPSALASTPSRDPSTGLPDFSPYMAKSANSNRSLQYFMVGTLGLLAASGAKSTVADVLSNLGASADVLALAKVEVEMASIPEGK